jgi:hypothetical protein
MEKWTNKIKNIGPCIKKIGNTKTSFSFHMEKQGRVMFYEKKII